MNRIAKALSASALLLGLAACHHEAKTSDQRTASGEVLAGSISDSMISYESLKSHPPVAPRSAERPGRATAADTVPGDGASAAPEAAPAEAAAPVSAASPIAY